MRCLNGRNHKFICINVGQVKRIAKVLDPLLEKYPLCSSVSIIRVEWFDRIGEVHIYQEKQDRMQNAGTRLMTYYKKLAGLVA